jgi:hypothetical protein
MNKRRGRGPLWFCVKFLVFVSVLVTLWWWFVLPAYGWLLMQLTGGVLKFVVGLPIEAGRIDAKGVFNTGTDLVFCVDGRDRVLHIALLATNVPPYLALVLATAGLAFGRRLRVLLYGCAILCAGHAIFIVTVMRFQAQLMRASEIPTAVTQFFLTLPFLLWIAFAYWDKIMSTAGAAGQGQPNHAPASPEHTGEEKTS